MPGATLENTVIPILWLAFAILATAVVFDLRTRQIPDTLSVCLLILALVATAFRLHAVSWLDLALGAAVGLGAGVILFQLGGFGGGDVKLLTTLGAVLGFRDELHVLFYIAIVGGVFATAAHFLNQREYPYAPAIACGLLIFILRGHPL